MCVYELYLYKPDRYTPSHFGEFRGPMFLPDGKPNLDSTGKPITIPIFPIVNQSSFFRCKPTLCSLPGACRSDEYAKTREDPDGLKAPSACGLGQIRNEAVSLDRKLSWSARLTILRRTNTGRGTGTTLQWFGNAVVCHS